MILVYLKAAFSLWMLVDAARRRADYYWFMIIFLPFGALAYFFVVKIHDYDLKGLKKLLALQRPPSVQALRQRVDEAPSVENKILLAQGLYDAKAYNDAEALFTEILERDEADKEALYGLGLCEINLGKRQQATAHLTDLIELDPAFQDYEPWFDLAFAYWQQDEKQKAVAVLKRLVETAPRIKHKAILGKYLARSGQSSEARQVLEEAIGDYREATAFVRRTSGRWAMEARTALKEVGK